ncbi:peptide/nickel transport system permease protein [Alkalispirochaeta americana]|uniref:Peptide/nickel transport system permease protein n=1 Tax=Alkalispirochaeta americana TaxID=159291 RepID=A0A1N6QEQ2_9SPIO|nr:ABC transporter permease [Alkalispirochaeta americana]SIQ15083.1 peptide/nickel transport system permease protein [Alkalispirochaeta americana]
MNTPQNETARSAPRRRTRLEDTWRQFRKNKGAIVGSVLILLLAGIALAAPLAAPEGLDDQHLGRRFQAPSRENILGTDNLGRDILSRIIHGSRLSLSIGFITTSIGLVAGGSLGAIAGYYGGNKDQVIMRFMDIILAIPGFIFAVALVTALGPNLLNLMIAVGLNSIPYFARIIRSSVLSVKEEEYIQAARVLGCSNGWIIVKHVIPNAFAPILVQATLRIGDTIIIAAGLSFLGLGAQPPLPEWGAMLSAGRQYLRDAWWMATFPGIAIMITVLAFNLVGDGLRDALDPRLKS